MKIQSALMIATLSSTYSLAQEQGVSTQGVCHKRVAPDRGQITISANESSKDAKEARKRASQKMEKFRQALKKLNLPDQELESTDASVQPQYEWDKNRNVLRGYTANYSLQISTSAFERLGEVLDVAVEQGIKNIGQLSSFLSRDLMKEEKTCLEQATKDAKDKAEILAASLGARIGKPIRIYHEPGNNYSPRPMAKMERTTMMADAGGASPAFDPGLQDIQTNVSVTFELTR